MKCVCFLIDCLKREASWNNLYYIWKASFLCFVRPFMLPWETPWQKRKLNSLISENISLKSSTSKIFLFNNLLIFFLTSRKKYKAIKSMNRFHLIKKSTNSIDFLIKWLIVFEKNFENVLSKIIENFFFDFVWLKTSNAIALNAFVRKVIAPKSIALKIIASKSVALNAVALIFVFWNFEKWSMIFFWSFKKFFLFKNIYSSSEATAVFSLFSMSIW